MAEQSADVADWNTRLIEARSCLVAEVTKLKARQPCRVRSVLPSRPNRLCALTYSGSKDICLGRQMLPAGSVLRISKVA
jgi:hypothetical protein